MFRVAIIGVMAVFLALPLKKDKPEFSMLIILSSCLIILGLALSRLGDIVSFIRQVSGYIGDGSLYIDILLKIIGITYVAEFSSNICRDAGYGAAGNQIDFFGRLMILAVSMPILMTLIETISKF